MVQIAVAGEMASLIAVPDVRNSRFKGPVHTRESKSAYSPRSRTGRICNYREVSEAKDRLSAYFRWYNQERLHQSLAYNTPESVYTGRVTLVQKAS